MSISGKTKLTNEIPYAKSIYQSNLDDGSMPIPPPVDYVLGVDFDTIIVDDEGNPILII